MPLEALREPITPVGLHYLLIHYDIPHVDPASWRLTVDGAVDHELSLDLGALRARPATELASTMECAGNGRARLEPRPISQPWLLEAVGTGRWRGPSLAGLLQEARPAASAREVLFTGLDRGLEKGEEQWFQRSLPLDEALRPEVLLAYDLNGDALPPQHGFPLRLLVPGWYGMTNVKWLSRITLIEEPFTGYQQLQSYRLRQDPDEPGHALDRIFPRALLIPPGIPDFMSRERQVERGRQTLRGRAWSGHAPITAVDVSVDGGESWSAATLEPSDLGDWAWRGFTYEWDAAAPGTYVVCCRARDDAGNVQPIDAAWNVGGYANNSVQRVAVTVH